MKRVPGDQYPVTPDGRYFVVRGRLWRRETIAEAIPRAPKPGSVRRIEVYRKAAQVFSSPEDGSVVAVYPATIGSQDSPSPTGTDKVKDVSRMPTYTYNPKINFQQDDNKRSWNCQAGRTDRWAPYGLTCRSPPTAFTEHPSGADR